MTRSTFLSYSPPSLGQEEIDEVVDTLRTDWITTGPKVKRFEQDFTQFIGAPASLAVSSATDAMLVALAALGIAPGDEVITTTMTFCSTVHVIEHLGARPVLVDVSPDTLNIDPAHVAAAITPRTRAIMPVHLYGHPCDMDPLLALAARYGLSIVEDAAHALPAAYKGRTIGIPTPALSAVTLSAVEGSNLHAARPISNLHSPISNLTSFSFYATKNMTTAEGGMLTGDPALIDKARLWSLHGMSRDAYNRYSAAGSWFYEVVLPGFKCNMTDISAAIGLQQLKKLPAFQVRRREIVRQYNAAFAALPELQTPACRPDVDHAWHIYALRLNLAGLTIDRSQFIEQLKAHNIGASVHFIPNHLQPYYRDKYAYQPMDYPVAYTEYQRLISLPLHPRMTDADVSDVIAAVTAITHAHRRPLWHSPI